MLDSELLSRLNPGGQTEIMINSSVIEYMICLFVVCTEKV